MKIEINSGERSFSIIFPTALLFTRVGLSFLRRRIKKENGDYLAFTYKNMRPVYKTVKTMRKEHDGWTLVSVRSSDGDEIIIKV